MSFSEEYNDSSFGTTSYMPVVIGLIGIALGALGTIIAFKAQSATNRMNEALEADKRLAAEVKEELHEMDQRLVTLTSRLQQVSQQNQGDQIIEQVRLAIGRFQTDIKDSRESQGRMIEQINKLSDSIDELDRRTTDLVKSRSGGSRNPVVNHETEGSSPSGNTELRSSSGLYKVKSGDNFTKIARQHNVSLSALIQANPHVDYNRLLVGQEIRIP